MTENFVAGASDRKAAPILFTDYRPVGTTAGTATATATTGYAEPVSPAIGLTAQS